MCAVSGGGNDEGVKQNIKPGRYWIHQAALRGEAPWWLQHVYNQQQDGDVQLMAEHALSVLTSEVRSQLEIYNVPVLSDCDHVPAVYGTDTTMAEEVAGTGIVLRAEKFRQQWNEAASFLIQLFRDVIKAFKEKRRSAGVVIQVMLSADDQEELPGIVSGKHSASYLPAEIPETGEPESAENIIRTQELPVSLLQSPRKKKSRRKSVLKSQAETRVRHRINNSQKMRTGTWGKYGFRWGAAYSIKGSLYITACRSSDFRGVIYPTKFAVRQAMNVLPVILRKNAPWICVQSELIH